ncbi:hypothetical protein [Streptomyces sp. NPDC092129]|uniref:hypothetical protein n=1 Tax=Streptomyces sp. NPDC092129 TaxID=3366010 RepID=UPI0038274473
MWAILEASLFGDVVLVQISKPYCTDSSTAADAASQPASGSRSPASGPVHGFPLHIAHARLPSGTRIPANWAPGEAVTPRPNPLHDGTRSTATTSSAVPAATPPTHHAAVVSPRTAERATTPATPSVAVEANTFR